MRVGDRKGFTLIEVIVVAGIIAILAGILVPLIFKEIDESKITRASADIRSISSAMIVFKKDAGQWPTKDSECSDTTLVNGRGNLPGNLAAMGFDMSLPGPFDALTADAGCVNNWKGPYMAAVAPDPWGNAYVVNSKDFSGTGPVWILSAGPNGVIDTTTTSQVTGNDDIGARLQ